MSNENKTAVKEFVQRYINSHEPDTFARNENGLMMYQLKHSGINLESFFEDIIEDFISEQNELASLQTQSIVEDKEIHIEALQDQVPEMCNENKTALTAEEQAKEYLDTIQVSGEYYQSKIGNSIIHLQNIMTDFAEEFASLQTQEKDKEIAELKEARDEREELIKAFDAIRMEFEGRKWLMEGRGNYRYDDEKYKEEVRYIMDAFNEINGNLWRKIKSKTFEYRNSIESPLKSTIESQQKEIESLKSLLSRYVELDPLIHNNSITIKVLNKRAESLLIPTKE